MCEGSPNEGLRRVRFNLRSCCMSIFFPPTICVTTFHLPDVCYLLFAFSRREFKPGQDNMFTLPCCAVVTERIAKTEYLIHTLTLPLLFENCSLVYGWGMQKKDSSCLNDFFCIAFYRCLSAHCVFTSPLRTVDPDSLKHCRLQKVFRLQLFCMSYFLGLAPVAE